MPEASDTLINSLNARIDALTRDLATANSESKTRKITIRDLTAKLTAAGTDLAARDAALTTLTTERDGLKTAATAAPGEKDITIAELQAKLRTRSHQDRFNELAADCDPSALAAAWKLSGYTAETDEPDDAKITEAIGRVKTDLPLAFKTDGVPSPKTLAPGPGSGRGEPLKALVKLRVSKAQLRDHTFMKANQKAISEASAAGTVEFTD